MLSYDNYLCYIPIVPGLEIDSGRRGGRRSDWGLPGRLWPARPCATAPGLPKWQKWGEGRAFQGPGFPEIARARRRFLLDFMVKVDIL